MNKYKYIDSYSEGQTNARMRLFGDILPAGEYSFGDTNPAEFVSELDHLINSGVKKLFIDINSDGGDVKGGWSIFSAINTAPIETITNVVGISASMSGIISQAGKKRTISDYALFHAHAPRPANEGSADADIINKITSSLSIILQSRSKISSELISDFMSKETYLTSEEAFDLGLFDEVIKTGVKVKNKSEIFSFVNKMYYNKTSKKMIKVLAKLNLNEGAEEKEILSAIEKIETDFSDKIATLEANEKTLKEEIKKERIEKATSLVDQAEKDGKVIFGENTALKTTWINSAVENYEATKNMIDSIQTVQKSVSIENSIDTQKDERASWTYEDWSKKDSSGLLDMKNSNPKRFEKLFSEYVNS